MGRICDVTLVMRDDAWTIEFSWLRSKYLGLFEICPSLADDGSRCTAHRATTTGCPSLPAEGRVKHYSVT